MWMIARVDIPMADEDEYTGVFLTGFLRSACLKHVMHFVQHTAVDDAALAASEWCKRVEQSLCHEFCAPCARRASGGLGAVVDTEATLFRDALRPEERAAFQGHEAERSMARGEESKLMVAVDEVARRCCRGGLAEGIFRARGVSLGVLPEMNLPYPEIDEERRRGIIAQWP